MGRCRIWIWGRSASPSRRMCPAPRLGPLWRAARRAADFAGLFTAALWKRYPDAWVLPSGTEVLPIRGLRDSLMTVAQGIGQLRGGGPDLSAPITWLQTRNKAVDLFIGLTDSEEWGAGSGRHAQGFLAAWQEYRRDVAPDAQVELIQLAPNDTRVSPAAEPSVHYVYGWSDSVLRYVGLVAQWPRRPEAAPATHPSPTGGAGGL